MDSSRRTVTKYLNNEKTHCALNSKFFKKLDHLNNQLYRVEVAKAEIEHKEPVAVGCFSLQHANLRMMQPYYNFFEKFCDINNFEEFEMGTNSLYLSAAPQELTDFLQPEMKAEWRKSYQLTAMTVSRRMHQEISSSELVARKTRNMTKESRVSSKKKSSVLKCRVFLLEVLAVMILSITIWKSAANFSINW